jgi:hypothetical protein
MILSRVGGVKYSQEKKGQSRVLSYLICGDQPMDMLGS